MSWEFGLIAVLIALIGKLFLGRSGSPKSTPQVEDMADDMKEVRDEERKDVAEAGGNFARNLARPLADRVRDILRWRTSRLGTGDDDRDDGE